MERKCQECGSGNVIKNGHRKDGSQKYRCRECGSEKKPVENGHPPQAEETVTKIGMSLRDFRSRYDVDFIVGKTLAGLKKDTVYEKSDVYRLCGLRAGFPGLSATLEDKKYSEYRGRTGGKDYFSHPDTIKELINDAILQ